MKQNDRPMTEDQRVARASGYAVLTILLLIVLSATAFAGSRRPAATALGSHAAATSVPTKSPTYQRPTPRSATPVSASQARSAPATIPGQTVFDANTVALYHFDSQVGNLVPDAGGQYTGTLYGNASVFTPGLYGGGLQLSSNGSYVKVSNLPALPQGTIEAFVDFQSVCDARGYYGYPLFSLGGDYGSKQSVAEVRVEGYLHFQMLIPAPTGWLTSTSGITACRYLTDYIAPIWPYEAWRYHHIAATWGPRGMETWVDGVLHGEATSDTFDINGHYNLNYACNPQKQTENNPIYPLCPTPVLLATAIPPALPPNNAPPGDYFGSLPTFTTLLIGCDTFGGCSQGHIDEVRISNIQRTFSTSVVPTSTPTPTQTPDVISGPYAPDAYTKELYHFDYNCPRGALESVSGLCSANFEGNTSIVSGRFNTGVFLGGADSYLLLHQLSNPTQGVIEAWVNLASATNVNIIHGGSDYKGTQTWGMFRLGVDPSHSSSLLFAVRDQYWRYADSHVNPAALVGAWHHVAGTWGQRGLEIWIDGQLCGTDSYTGHSEHNSDNYLVGCDAQGNCMQGTVDEVRFSNIQRSFVLAAGAFAPRLGSVPATATRVSAQSTRSAPASVSSAFQLFFPLLTLGNNGGITITPAQCTIGSASPAAIKSIP